MRPEQNITLNTLLADRKMNGAELSRAIPTGEAVVSRIRNGMAPGPKLQARISDVLELTDEEIAALGWDKERANA